MKNLPEEVIEEIVLRLPLKSLLRFRCVSKSWLSLISSPHFAQSHFERSSPHSNRILYTITSEARSIDFNASLRDDSAIVRLDLPIFEVSARVQIMGSCRGFLLILIGDCIPYIWNPSTGECKQIPDDPFWKFVFLCGFGYDASTDDYLIVVLAYDIFASYWETELHIFSLTTNSWKKLEDRHWPYMNLKDDIHLNPMAGSILNGAIHWLALHLDQVSYGAIIAFDLAERNLREIPIPDDFIDEYSAESYDLEILGGNLSLIDKKNPNRIEIWVMKEYGVKSSWTMHMTLSLVKIHTSFFSPICFTQSGQVVGIYGSTGLIKCNDKGKLLEGRQCFQGRPRFAASASVYTESLLSLPGGRQAMVTSNRD